MLQITPNSRAGLRITANRLARGFAGRSVAGVGIINLSASTISDAASIGTVIGLLSVSDGTGTYTYSFTSNPGTLFSITTNQLKVAAALTAGSDPITIQADNGVDTPITRAFLITVTSSAVNHTSLYVSQGIY